MSFNIGKKNNNNNNKNNNKQQQSEQKIKLENDSIDNNDSNNNNENIDNNTNTKTKVKKENDEQQYTKERTGAKLSFTPKEKVKKEPIEKATAEIKKYTRGDFANPNNIKNPVLQQRLKKYEKNRKEAAKKNLQSELMLAEGSSGFIEADKGEKTYKYKQHQIEEHVDLQTSAKMFELVLTPNGPFEFDFTRNGKHLLIAGESGYVATVEWKRGKKFFEKHLQDSIRDACFLHNETMFALAQKNFVYIYDNQGTQLHQLKSHPDPGHVAFLPYHFLLLSTSLNPHRSFITYEDVSIGSVVAKHEMKSVATAVTVNVANGVVHSGDAAGVVSLWTPNTPNPVVKILAHSGNVTGVATSLSGNYMVTAGHEGVVKVFDLRNSFQEMHSYKLKGRPTSISLSDTNVLAVANGTHTVMWKNPFDTAVVEPYLNHRHYANSTAKRVRFCPFEDFLGVSHEHGYSSWVVPGSATANFDSKEADIYETTKARNEREVRQLLEKIPHDMIHLNQDYLGKVDQKISTEEKKFKREIKAQPDARRMKFDQSKRDRITETRLAAKHAREDAILNPTEQVDALSRFTKKRK
ncbi:WD40 repeat-containing protein [Cavenderia fasciculata]|uniref:WD40 repeat-containing protein n=1 Tax=Cavenderia fasciculata TaxID=261658 RepID=F4QAE3_CACFS|nr:WD40 repeat-containing protein [Cavenderia fasciculata]EGG15662.1 WD40 repeat-containing protein [Cavenderia fasciculata]|eukprot:XP_004354404.1 WD40 repeat-containing protein [Cavenderia fasciculata]